MKERKLQCDLINEIAKSTKKNELKLLEIK